MTKREAKELAHRVVTGLMEEYNSKTKFDVYDALFGKEHEGRRLSEADQDRLDDAFCVLQGRLSDVGDVVWTSFQARDGKRSFAKPAGKPGRRWGRYADRQKQWGR